MTREDFILTRLRDEYAMYRALFIVCVIAAIGGLVLCAAMIAGRGFAPALAGLSITVTLGGYAMAARGSCRSLAAALREIEADPEGLAFPEDYSVATATAIEKAQLPTKDYRAQAVAYLVTAAMMVAGGVFIIAMVGGLFDMDFYDADFVFAILGSLLAAGGLLVGILGVKAMRNFNLAKRLGPLPPPRA